MFSTAFSKYQISQVSAVLSHFDFSVVLSHNLDIAKEKLRYFNVPTPIQTGNFRNDRTEP